MTATPPEVPPLRIRVLDTVFRLQPRYRETYEVLRRDWSRCLVESGDPASDRPHELRGEQDPLPHQFGYNLASQLTRAAIEDLAGRAILLHAAGLADDAGRVVAFVAPSGSGKTTLARALGLAGLGYVTDETVAIMPGGAVLHYEKPLSVLDDSTGSRGKSQFGPDTLGLAAPPREVRISRLVVLDRQVDHVTEPRLTSLPLLEGVLALLPQSSALARLPAPLQELCRLVERCGAWRLTYSEADGVAPLVRGLLGTPYEPSERWEPIGDERGTAAGASPRAGAAPGGATHRWGEHRDAVRIGEEGVVLVGLTALRLGPLGLTLWERCGSGATIEELEETAVAAHGPSPEAHGQVRAAVAAMVGAGLLTET
ncbi:MAG: hypothetical protein GX427_06450 [Actinomycetales bacterium]|nr:hypothetical protein [Actinomycetales bacterium]